VYCELHCTLYLHYTHTVPTQVTVDSEVIADATASLSGPSQHCPVPGSNVVEDTPRCSAGSKRKLSETATDGEWEEECFDHRAATLKGLHRKNCTRYGANATTVSVDVLSTCPVTPASRNCLLYTCRVDAILKLKEDLAALRVPLVVIEYNHDDPHSASSRSGGTVHGSVAVTPLHTSTDRVHPIAHILIALSTINTNTTNNNTDAQEHAVSGHKAKLTSPGGDGSSRAAHCRAAALFTDDLLHPLDVHVHRAIEEALPDLSVYSVDSNSQFALQVGSENKHFGMSDAPAVMSFEEYCRCVEQQDVVEQGQEQEWPALDTLKVRSRTLIKFWRLRIDF